MGNKIQMGILMQSFDNLINEDILGSMEFACKVADSKLIIVLYLKNN